MTKKNNNKPETYSGIINPSPYHIMSLNKISAQKGEVKILSRQPTGSTFWQYMPLQILEYLDEYVLFYKFINILIHNYELPGVKYPILSSSDYYHNYKLWMRVFMNCGFSQTEDHKVIFPPKWRELANPSNILPIWFEDLFCNRFFTKQEVQNIISMLDWHDSTGNPYTTDKIVNSVLKNRGYQKILSTRMMGGTLIEVMAWVKDKELLKQFSSNK